MGYRLSTLTVANYKEALESLYPLKDHHNTLLEFHYRSPNYTTTATELAHAAGWKHYRTSNLHYGKLARKLCEALEIPKERFYLDVLYRETAKDPVSGHWLMTLNPKVVTALDALGWYR